MCRIYKCAREEGMNGGNKTVTVISDYKFETLLEKNPPTMKQTGPFF